MKNKAMFWMMLLCGIPSLLIGQEIKLTNASFEDVPNHSSVPYGWNNCGDVYESPPDIQPGFFEVEKMAQRGRSYVGLVTRDNDTWEGISQKMSKPIVAGKCYKFNIYLAKSSKYISLSKSSMTKENFNQAVRLRIWGGNSHCHKKEILAETGPINHPRNCMVCKISGNNEVIRITKPTHISESINLFPHAQSCRPPERKPTSKKW